MSNIMHLIENAICCLEKGKKYEDFISAGFNPKMLKMVKSPAEEIWEIAIYVYTTYRENIEWTTEERLEKAYGYPVPKD